MAMETLANPARQTGRRGFWLDLFTRLTKTKLISLVLVFDLAAFVGLGLLALMSRSSHTMYDSLVPPVTIGLVALVAVYILQRLWAYTISALGAFVRQVRAVLIACTGAFVLVMGLYFLLDIPMIGQRAWLLLWSALVILVLVPFRLLVSRVVQTAERRGELQRRAVIVGGGKACEDLIARLERTGERAIRILGLFDDRGGDRSPEQVGHYRKIGTFEELETYARENAVDLLIIALPPSAEERILHLLKRLWQLPVDVRIAAHVAKLKLAKRAYTYIGDVPFLAVFDRPLSDWNTTVKALFDRIVAALVLVALLPVMLLVALAIKLDSRGPVFFRQQRFGFNNNLIGVYKFRSMYADQADLHARKQVTKDDPRVTRVGRFIRRTSLDELPQLINVLRGELSLVGPRPHATQTMAANQLYQDVVAGYFARHRMKPGITGWAQVNGWRGETDTVEKIERRVEHDLYYIENWSLVLDLYILAMTPFSLLNLRNAY